VTPVAAIAQSGLAAATLKLSASASNTANARDTSAVGASGYQPLGVVDSAVPDGGVTAQAVNLKPASLLAYDPTSPLSNPQGYVQAPEIDPISEISSQMAASQAFAYSLKVLRAAKQEQQTLVDLKT
jgi:flagellar basal-body rod protein FlgC